MVSLAQIEQEVGARVGPYLKDGCSATPSTGTLVYVDALKSSGNLGGLTDLWLLRRGKKTDGTSIVGFVSGDRQRLVKTYSSDDGYLEVDHAYTTAPVADEEIEVHLLDPRNQLRPAVLAGLRRCYVADRVTVALAGAAAERDLTAALPWLTEPWQVLDLSWSLGSNPIFAPQAVPFFRAFSQGGSVYVDSDAFDPFPYTVYVSVLRPAWTKVNGLSAPPIPTVADTTGGSLLANTVYNAAVAAQTPDGTSPASPVTKLYTATDASNTHAARLTIPQVSGARNYLIYLSTAAAPLRVATISETQRAAGVTVTAVDTISATSPGAGMVDVRIAGTSTAAVQAAGPTSDDDTLDLSLEYAAAAGHIEAWRRPGARVILAAVAADGRGLSQQDAAAEFTNQSRWIAALTKQRIRVAEPVLPDLVASWGAF